MAPELDPPSEFVRSRMKNQRRADTKPEIELRRLLHSMHLRYRVAYPVPGLPRRTIDVAFPGRRLAIFVDGCFWHRCPIHHVPAKNNAAWWAAKLEANVDRDRSTDEALQASGWTVIRIWEHEDMTLVAQRVEAMVHRV